jgi:glycerol-3-phosphate dehydrogenase
MQRIFSALEDTPFDVAIIGGGATGAAIALDCALRGLKTALAEKGDFSAATSAASSKLMHGGLRYLANGEIGLVREGLRERGIWQRIAKHLVRPLPFVLPTYQPFMQSRNAMRLGLTAYDWLAVGRNFGADSMQRMPGYRAINTAQTMGLMPGLDRDGINGPITGGMIYHDAQMLSPERLCLAMVRSAVNAGAVAVNYAAAQDFTVTGNKIETVTVKDMTNGKKARLRASVFVNAAGPWADGLMQQATKAPPPKKLVRSKGIHFLTRDITRGTALAMPVDGEHLFVLPWQGMSLFATTDTAYPGDPDKVAVGDDDIAALLGKAQKALPRLGLTRKDIVYAYAGLRPLVADPADVKPYGAETATYGLSRGAEILDHKAHGGPEGLISALGGKWTTARRLAEQVTDAVFRHLQRPTPTCRTGATLLACCPPRSLADFMDDMRESFPHIGHGDIDALSRLYGTMLPDMMAMDTSGLEALRDPLLAARTAFAVQHEMAIRLDDIVRRRLHEGQTGALSVRKINAIADYMADRQGWSEAEKAKQLKQTQKAMALPPARRKGKTDS